MTDLFLKIIKPVLEHESGYANVKGDSGGETYKGIARNYHSYWTGWDIIDEYKEVVGEIKHGQIFNNTLLDNLVLKFYYEKFYLQMNLDGITDEIKILNIFDFAVNAGIIRPVKLAQKIINVKQDGRIGTITTKAINECNDFVDKYKKERIAFYHRLVKRKPEYIKFLKGWINRVNNCHF